MKVFVLAFLLVGLAFADSDMDRDEYEIYKSAGFKVRRCVMEKIMVDINTYKLKGVEKDVLNILMSNYLPKCWESVADLIDITQEPTEKQFEALNEGEKLYDKMLTENLNKRMKEAKE